MKLLLSTLVLAALLSCTSGNSNSLATAPESEAPPLATAEEASLPAVSSPETPAAPESVEPATALSSAPSQPKEVQSASVAPAKGMAKGRHFVGSFSNGMKGAKFSFDISEDGQRMENVIYQGYWYCGSKLELTTAGPDGHFTIQGNKVEEFVVEPPDGGSTAWRFDMTADFQGDTASGTFRMNINNLGCNTGMLNWTAKTED